MPKAIVISVDPQETKDISNLQELLDDGYKMLSAASAHDRVIYVFIKS